MRRLHTLSLVVVSLAVAASCRADPRRGPEQLRAAYLDALERDDPDAAYDLLAPEVQAEVTREEFRERWASMPEERAAQRSRIEQAPGSPLMSGTTAHPGGRVVRWVEVEGRYVMVGGLPRVPDTGSPESTVRALIAALRARDEHSLEGLVEETLLEETREELEVRLEALEEALASPTAFDFTPDMSRAVLRYARGRSIVLERNEGEAWRIVAIE